jgi:hypothetical protein
MIVTKKTQLLLVCQTAYVLSLYLRRELFQRLDADAVIEQEWTVVL